MSNEMIFTIMGGLITVLGYFLSKLHEDHSDLKKRLMSLEIENGGQKATHNAMAETLQEIKHSLKELPSTIMQVVKPHLDRIEEKMGK
jgi:hypothetical protein